MFLDKIWDPESKVELGNINHKLCQKYSESMHRKIEREIQNIGDCEDGGINSGKLWKLKKNLSPNNSEPPSAMEDSEENVLTSEVDILSKAVKHYKAVFEPQKMTKNLKDNYKERELICMEIYT